MYTQLLSRERERGVCTHESPSRACDEIPLPKRPWVPPILESKPVLPAHTTEVIDQAEEDETEDEHDLQHRTGELDLAEHSDQEDVRSKRDHYPLSIS